MNSATANWRVITRGLVTRDHAWKPLICIQGGGARGAWEAGVLAALLKSRDIGTPVCCWGTSAGAINAYWGATLPLHIVRRQLVRNWLILASRVRTIFVILLVLALSFIAAIIISHAVRLFATVALSFAFFFVALCLLVQKRLPGFVSVKMAALLLPRTNMPHRFYAYYCAANVDNDVLPTEWEWDSLGVFAFPPGLPNGGRGNDMPKPDIAVMTSAALPILCNPLTYKKRHYLDGGLVANLPAGHLRSYGLAGGHCAICIVPRRLEDLDLGDHVDYRVAVFLNGMRESQTNSRQHAAESFEAGCVYTGPAHTHRPVFVIKPETDLQSGLLTGFFLPSLLVKEYWQGYCTGRQVIERLRRFAAGDNASIDSDLLDNHVLPAIPPNPPAAGLWALFANVKWLRRGCWRNHVGNRTP